MAQVQAVDNPGMDATGIDGTDFSSSIVGPQNNIAGQRTMLPLQKISSRCEHRSLYTILVRFNIELGVLVQLFGRPADTDLHVVGLVISGVTVEVLQFSTKSGVPHPVPSAAPNRMPSSEPKSL